MFVIAVVLIFIFVKYNKKNNTITDNQGRSSFDNPAYDTQYATHNNYESENSVYTNNTHGTNNISNDRLNNSAKTNAEILKTYDSTYNAGYCDPSVLSENNSVQSIDSDMEYLDVNPGNKHSSSTEF